MRARGPAVAFAAALALALVTAAPAHGALKPVGDFGIYDTTDAAGSASGVEGVGVDPISGRVAIPDYSYDRISIFSPRGRFLFAFGHDVKPGGGTGAEVCRTVCQAGTDGGDAGELNNPEDVEFSTDGRRLWVSDSSNNRISVFDRKGRFLFAFGLEVEPGAPFGFERCEETCQAGTAGDEAGAMDFPWAGTFGPRGTFWVADTDNNRVQSFAPNGDFRLALGRDVTVGGSTGYEVCDGSGAGCKAGTTNGSGSLTRPEGLDFDPRGRLWAASYNEQHANVYSRTLEFVRTFGKGVDPGGGDGFEICTSAICSLGQPGAELGEFNSPQGLGIAPDGTVFVADAGNNRLAAYSAASRPLFAFGDDVIPGGGTGRETCRAGTGCQAGDSGTFDGPYGVSTDCRGVVFVNNTGSNAGDHPVRAFSQGGKAKPKPCELKAKGQRDDELKVFVPYPGKVKLKGAGLRPDTARHRGPAGIETLEVDPRRRGEEGRTRAKIILKPSDDNVKQIDSARVRVG
jgi:DNA-binding beta-propeller fold protein YncE